MAVLASTPIAGAQALLNDTGGAIYPASALLPLCAKAYRELQNKMVRRGILSVREITSVPITVAAGTLFLGDGAGLPADLIEPISMEERAVGAGDFTPMSKEDYEPIDVDLTNELRFWAWREEQIKFIGALVDRQVRIYYRKGLTPLTTVNTPIEVIGCETYLEARTAELGARFIGENPARAAELKPEVDDALDELLATKVMESQDKPIRRRVNRYRR